MEVTRKNFDDVLPNLPGEFQKAQFIAFDTEFTGLELEGEEPVTKFDTCRSYYVKCKKKVDKFMIMQYGIVAFYYDEETNSYSHKGYNFYVFPSSLNRHVNFTCQASSLDFLTRKGFDFNKAFAEGISYLTDGDMRRLKENLKSKFRENDEVHPRRPRANAKCKDFIQDLLDKIDEAVTSNATLKIVLTDKNRYSSRKMIYKTLKDRYGSRVYIATDEIAKKITITCHTREQIKKDNEENYKRRKKEILDHLGFAKVVKLLINSCKLLVGHNLLLDLMFTMRQFVMPLPDTYEEFAEAVRGLFPKIADTKFMSKDTELQATIEGAKNAGELTDVKATGPGEGFALDDGKDHEAGYDAYLTGLYFLRICKDWGEANNKAADMYKSLASMPVVANNVNKLATPSLHLVSCMDLERCEGEPDRSNVFHVTFPRKWQRGDLVNLFKDCYVAGVGWINQVSAYVHVDKEDVSHVEEHLMKSKSTTYTITRYADHARELAKSGNGSRRKEDDSDSDSDSSSNDSPPRCEATRRKMAKLEDVGEIVW